MVDRMRDEAHFSILRRGKHTPPDQPTEDALAATERES
jgi:cytochrome c oxidase subunit I